MHDAKIHVMLTPRRKVSNHITTDYCTNSELTISWYINLIIHMVAQLPNEYFN
jgi:hypothetical protein